jgi:hypothetical protein
MARELHLTRATVSRNCEAGMPLTSVAAAQQWRRQNVREKYDPTNYLARQMAASDLETEPEQFDANGMLTIAGADDALEFCLEIKQGMDALKAELLEKLKTLDDGARIICQHGPADWTPKLDCKRLGLFDDLGGFKIELPKEPPAKKTKKGKPGHPPKGKK